MPMLVNKPEERGVISYLLYRAGRAIPSLPMSEPTLHALQMNHSLTCIALQYDGAIADFLEANWTHLTI